eukprot:CAMPEP_0202960816 /NCGR_PEP_ID=MMETSP1396-20130829/4969_1 /ASSEMBLY_ACC=CAM_ASM_000872 /TAXON_ID= /ORGANISM="Pseudokeronopsis sp., Strain Brazil" /LENGTH=62 /DNA_ID=CAMNT_0049680281 /DNA_START=348 /DNA_END=536 /DNA_ORIENTATION=-
MFQQQMAPQIEKRFNTYQSSIKTDKVQEAQKKVDQASKQMKENVIEMTKNVHDVESQLLPAS